MIRYFEVAKEVAPRRKRVQEMEKKMMQSQRDLAKTEQELQELERQIKELSENFKIKDAELKELKQKADQMAKYLDSAAKLIAGLSSEQTRWTKDQEFLSNKTTLFPGDCLLASAFLSYTGAFNFQYRTKMIYNDWQSDIIIKSIPMTQPFNIQNLLTTEVERSEWISQGLPGDELSIQNGILTTQASRYPLCIDPQMQAISWIKNKEQDHQVNIRTFNDADFVKILELSIQFGNSFIFEGVDEEIDPIIDPILEGNFIVSSKTDTQKQIKLGDSVLDWDDNFRLYLVSKLTNPKYTPEISGKTMIINFCVTQQGLEDQLLDVVVGHERPDLQSQREDLIQLMSKNNIMLAELENLLLKELTEATGNILENHVLIQTLQDAKQKSLAIQEQQVVSLETSKQLNQVASEYRSAAKRGSVLFFSISGLAIISRMYEYSLSSYLSLFVDALEKSKKDALISKRLAYIIDTLTKMVYDYACTGIFEKHKLMYSFQLASLIMEEKNLLNRTELDFFLKGNISVSETEQQKPKHASWIPDCGWKDILKLQTMSGFDSLIQDISAESPAWKQWYDLEKPEDADLPCGLSKNLTELQKLMVLRCFRPDRVYNALKNFVISVMEDDYFVQPPVLQYDIIFGHSSSTIPVVFILSKGADPMRDLEKLAHSYGLVENNKFKYLALGQGQATLAQQLLELGRTRGHWIVLQNCHLMPSWLKSLEKIIYDLKSTETQTSSKTTSKINENFRLWLTTDVTPDFPIGILQSSLKVVTEPPDGLKLNMKGSYSRVRNETLDDCPHRAFRSLVYVLSFFHAVVQERRKYGKLGWNVAYDFNESDYDTSLRLLSMYLTKSFDNQTKLPWESLKYLIGEVMYGGRVTDSFDRRTLITYLHEYMGDFVFDDFQQFFLSKGDNNGLNFDYIIPEYSKTVTVYNNMIDSLPLSNSPQVLGLHSNAEIGYYTASTQYLWKCVIDLQPRVVNSSESGFSREDHINTIAKDIAKKIPQKFDLPVLKKQFMDMASPDAIVPTTVVLLQEIERWNKLVSKMKQTLTDVQRALAGEIGMSPDLDDISSSLYNGFLPAVWKRYAPDTSKKLGSWINHFIERFKQYEAWIAIKQKNQQDNLVVVWLSGLHVPETYLAAIIQTTCRKNKWPLDKSELFTEVTILHDNANNIRTLDKLEDGCYINGLYLEGAGWDYEKAKLCRQEPKKLVYKLPITKVIPMESNKITRSNTFRTPVYVTQSRRNAMGVGLVFEADLATDMHQSHWILQGTAITLNIAD
jgi:dynein heavy chain